MKHVAACSFGKDSIATVILAREHNEPLDEVIYCEVMFDEEISGEVQEHTEFVSRLTAVEESAKQAHKRIDRIEEVQERERHE